ncbi:hypothetical protein GCM10009808_11190 [Microbacterium sediminicola]|uniref:Surface-anchored protein n=1 Tax=Microbacterium sediminicola TaxID=415210 RepID=A0ABN2HYY9_9MICO
MRFSLHRLSLAAVTTAALLAGVLTAPLSATATDPAATSLPSVTAIDADLVTVGLTEDGELDLRTRAEDGELYVPEEITLSAPSAEPFTATISAEEAVLPEGYSFDGPVSLSLVDLTAPENATVTIARADDNATLFAEPLTLDAGTSLPTVWHFSNAGSYSLVFAASAVVTDSETSVIDLTTREVTYTFDVTDSETTDSGAESTDADEAVAAQTAAVAPTEVVTEGDLRITQRIVDGQVELGLRQVGDEGAFGATWQEADSLVISVPNQDATWPAESMSTSQKRFWAAIAPEGTVLWRTAGHASLKDQYRSNAVTVSVDSGTMTLEDIEWLPQVSLSAVTGADGAAAPGDMVTYRTGSSDNIARVYWDGRIDPLISAPIDVPIASTTSDLPTYEGSTTTGFSFTASGVYCIALTTYVTSLATSELLSDTATYTFVVGNEIDPTTVSPCAQPETEVDEGIANHIREDGVAVLTDGTVRLASVMDGGVYELALQDATGESDTTRDAAEVILAIPTQDTIWPGARYEANSSGYNGWARLADAGTLLWRTPGEDDLPHAWRTNDLLIEGDATGLGMDTAGEQVVLTLQSVETTSSGYMTAYQTDDDSPEDTFGFPMWDSRGDGVINEVELSTVTEPLGWAFSEEGVYCVTVAGVYTDPAVGDASAASTYTVVVGDSVDVDTVEPCAQREYSEPVADEVDLDPTVHYMTSGHTDLSVETIDGGFEWRVGKTTQYLVDDVVWVGTTAYNEYVVPEVSTGLDYTFVADEGETYYAFPEASGLSAQTLWPGFSAEGNLDVDGSWTWTLKGMSGPENGEFLLYQTIAATEGRTARVAMDTRTGLLSWERDGAHSHINWAFTEPGVYCLNFEIAGYLDGEYSSDTQQLTVAVGPDLDLSTIQPCGRSGEEAPLFTAAEVTETEDDTIVQQDGQVLITPYLTDDSLEVTARVQDTPGDTIVGRDIEEIIFSSTALRSDGWVVGNTNNGDGQPDISWDTTHIAREDLDGDLTVSLGEVEGAGDMAISRTVWNADPLALGTGADDPTSAWWPTGWLSRHIEHTFSASGVYCVPLTWSGALADGTALEVTKTLTVVVGSTDPTDETYIDRSTVVPCADGGEGSEETPGDGGETPDEHAWDVENGSLTTSGATILNDGHVDIASVLESGVLDTKVKDTTESSDAVYRDAEDTVLQLLPDSETTIPASSTYSFLGTSGDPVWMVAETQQSGLLWPGWSTEEIALSATQTGVEWTLTDVSGPGEFALFSSSPTQLGAVDVRFNTRDGVTDADTFTIPQNTHAHGSWAFSAEGAYCLAFTRTTTLASGTDASDEFVLAVAVGDVDVVAIDPTECFTEPVGEPTDTDTTPIPESALTDESAGEVQVLEGTDGFTAGQLVTVQVGAEHAGNWVSVWLRSSPTWLGWSQVGSSGAVQVRLPADAATGAHSLIVEDRDGNLIGWDSLSVVTASDSSSDSSGSNSSDGDTTTDDTPAVTAVAASQCVAGATILSSGHIDYSTRIVGGKIESLIGDDTSGTKVYREPSGTVLWLKPSSAVTLPSGYGAIGAAGTTVWQVPQTQQSGLIWLGWSTESLNAGNTSSSVRWTLNSVSGPGTVKVYLTGAFGGVQQVVFNNGGTYNIPLGVHAHANWAFSAEGIYRLTMTQTATLANGTTSSDTEVLTIAVGDVDPASAVSSSTGCGTISNAVLQADDTDAAAEAAEQAQAEAEDAAADTLPGEASDAAGDSDDPLTALSGGNPVPMLVLTLGILLLLAAAGGGVLWWRSRRTP